MQPPPRGCVLKPLLYGKMLTSLVQPPPRGCVLKHDKKRQGVYLNIAAASARLCVETSFFIARLSAGLAAASARLCVETELSMRIVKMNRKQPPPRGCVLKH